MRITDVQTSAIVSAGIKLLRENLGVIESEIFITTIGNNDFDYTEWRENLWEDLSANELFEQAADLNYTAPSGVQTI